MLLALAALRHGLADGEISSYPATASRRWRITEFENPSKNRARKGFDTLQANVPP
jgi:hypothetical protein